VSLSASIDRDMGFDYLLFKGGHGLQAVGIAKQNIYGNYQRYKLNCYKDLTEIRQKCIGR